MTVGLFVLAAAILGAALLVRHRPDPAGAGDAAGRALQSRVDQTATAVSELAGKFEERRRLEEQATEAVGRIERLIAGSWSKGRAGENLLAAALGEFPPDLVMRDFTVGGRVCEFALVLAGGKVLPIDAKWPATALVERLEAETDPAARDEVRRQVERAVVGHLREVAGYIEPSLTAPMAVMVIPDPVFACCRRAHRTAKDLRVLLVSSSLAVPVLMAVWNLHGTYARDLDQAQLLGRVQEVGFCLQEMGERIEGQLSRGLKMAANAAAELRSLVVGARTSLDGLWSRDDVGARAGGED